MGKLFSILIFAIVAAIVVGYFTVGLSFFLGGPKKGDIVAVTRGVMEATAPSPEAAAQARAATVTPKGICNKNDDGRFACIVDVSVEGAEMQSLVTVLAKSPDGTWIASE